MTRIYTPLAVASLALMLGATLVGLNVGDLGPDVDARTLHWATIHRLSGVAAALAVVFVQCIAVTYFIGTSRWCKEVVETYQLDPSLMHQSSRLKRRTFPWALLGMLAVICVSALGAAGDPMAGLTDGPRWAQMHLVSAFAGIALIAWSYVAAWNNIYENHRIIEQIVAEVQRCRAPNSTS